LLNCRFCPQKRSRKSSTSNGKPGNSSPSNRHNSRANTPTETSSPPCQVRVRVLTPYIVVKLVTPSRPPVVPTCSRELSEASVDIGELCTTRLHMKFVNFGVSEHSLAPQKYIMPKFENVL